MHLFSTKSIPHGIGETIFDDCNNRLGVNPVLLQAGQLIAPRSQWDLGGISFRGFWKIAVNDKHISPCLLRWCCSWLLANAIDRKSAIKISDEKINQSHQRLKEVIVFTSKHGRPIFTFFNKPNNYYYIIRCCTIGLSDNEDEEDEIRVRDDSKKRKFVSSSNVRGPNDCVYKSDRGKVYQSTLDKNNPIKEKLKNIAWKKFAIWAYAVSLPFNVVCDESFQDVIDAIGDYGKVLGMSAPSYHNVRVTLIKEVLQDTNKFVDSFRSQWQKYGCSIMSDFWTDGKGRALINFLVNCPTGTFLTDNSSNYKAAGKILEEKHPKLFWTPCAAHCVNLMIKDLEEKIKKIKGALTDARAIVVYIYNHGRILNMMRKLTKNKELHRSCITRFATQYYTLQSVHENRHHLQVLFVSKQWTKSAFVKKVVGKKVERIVAKQEFWDDVYLSCQVFAPLVDMILLVDREDQPCMGYIYDAMSRANKQKFKRWA
ncbi:unnamed protein product [Lactuca saligna]|uniref:DUF659 domain-containing protein n=1 Tax=Lactuca saligna TaxID=75948 RepID=A0AA36E0E6_LACSI|nr:unnamed protein product [Lactuca saligna]